MQESISMEEWLETMPDYKTEPQKSLEWIFGVGEYANIPVPKLPPMEFDDAPNLEYRQTKKRPR